MFLFWPGANADSSPLALSRLSFLLFLADGSEFLSWLRRLKMFYPCRGCRAVSPEVSICLSPPPALQRLGQIIIMGYENFTWNRAFSETSRGCVIALLVLFISLDKACLMPLNVLVGIKKDGPNGNLLTLVLWCYRFAHIVAPWEQD